VSPDRDLTREQIEEALENENNRKAQRQEERNQGRERKRRQQEMMEADEGDSQYMSDWRPCAVGTVFATITVVALVSVASPAVLAGLVAYVAEYVGYRAVQCVGAAVVKSVIAGSYTVFAKA